MDGRFYHFFDKTLKFIISNNLSSFFLFFGINCLPLFLLSNEIIDSKLNRSLLDFPVLTLNGIVNIEFQLNTKDSDIIRFLRYGVQLFERYKIMVHSVVIDFQAKRDEPKNISLNLKDRLTIYIKSLIARNPDKILNNLKYKIENNIRLTGVDIVGFELLPLLDLKRKRELLKEGSSLIFLLNDEIISFKKLEEIRQVYLNYAEYWKDKETMNSIMEWSKMNEDFLKDAMIYYGEITREEGREEGRKEGREQGHAEGKAEAREEINYEIAQNMIDDGFPVETILKYSHLDLSIINQLILTK